MGGELEDFKGYHSLLKPAVEQLQSEGLNIELVLADRQLGFIPHDEMVKYYSQIDVYVCPSKLKAHQTLSLSLWHVAFP